jgi:hypothetical protein
MPSPARHKMIKTGFLWMKPAMSPPFPHATANFNIEAYGQDFYEIKVVNLWETMGRLFLETIVQ